MGSRAWLSTQTRPAPSLPPKGPYQPDHNAKPSSSPPEQTFSKGSISGVKEQGCLSALKGHISAIDVIPQWTGAFEDPFQTEFVQSGVLCGDDGVDPQREQEKALLIEN